MKTFYTSRTGSVVKIPITSEHELMVEEARQIVGQLSEQRDWWPSIHIKIQDSRDRSLDETHHEMPYFVQVSRVADEDSDKDNAVISVKAELGYYGDEGWKSILDGRDLRQIPDVWFEDSFVEGLTEGYYPEDVRELSTVLEPEHAPVLADAIRDAARDRIEGRIEVYSYRMERYNSLAILADDVLSQRATLDDFMRVLNEGNQSPAPDGEDIESGKPNKEV